jgi:hypothetical protein
MLRQGIVFVVDAADRGRLEVVREEMVNVIADEQLQVSFLASSGVQKKGREGGGVCFNLRIDFHSARTLCSWCSQTNKICPMR